MSLYSFDKSEKILAFDEVSPKHKITAYTGSYQYETLVLEHSGSIQELQNQNIELRTYTSASQLQSLKNTINSKRHLSSYYDYDAISGSADFQDYLYTSFNPKRRYHKTKHLYDILYVWQ